MYYGGWGHCNVVKLNDDFTGLVPFEDGTTYREVTPKDYVEGPFMFIQDGKYYFMRSEGGWTGPDYQVAYAIADSPFGPFERVGTILEQDPEIATGAGNNSHIHQPKKAHRNLFYQRRTKSENDSKYRIQCIYRLSFDA